MDEIAKGCPVCDENPRGEWLSLARKWVPCSECARVREIVRRAREEWERSPGGPAAYDATFGDERECACGHSYYRHFDTYDEMAPVGCKYCDCFEWQEPSALRAEEGGES